MRIAWCAAVATVALAGSVGAAPVTFDGPAGGNWFVAQNWSDDAVPTGGTDVLLDGTVSPVIPVSNAAATARNLQLAGNAALTQTSSTLVADTVSLGDSARVDLFSSFIRAHSFVVDCTSAVVFCRIAFNPSALAVQALSLDAAKLDFGLGGAAPASETQRGAGFHASIVASLDVTLLHDVELSLSLLHGFQPVAGQMFQLLTVGGVLSGQFAGLGEGALVEQFGDIALFITYQAGSGNDIAVFARQVPAPASLALFGIGLAAMAARRRAPAG